MTYFLFMHTFINTIARHMLFAWLFSRDQKANIKTELQSKLNRVKIHFVLIKTIKSSTLARPLLQTKI